MRSSSAETARCATRRRCGGICSAARTASARSSNRGRVSRANRRAGRGGVRLGAVVEIVEGGRQLVDAGVQRTAPPRVGVELPGRDPEPGCAVGVPLRAGDTGGGQRVRREQGQHDLAEADHAARSGGGHRPPAAADVLAGLLGGGTGLAGGPPGPFRGAARGFRPTAPTSPPPPRPRRSAPPGPTAAPAPCRRLIPLFLAGPREGRAPLARSRGTPAGRSSRPPAAPRRADHP